MDVAKANTAENNNNEEDEVLPGFRFHPTDEELVGFYLRRKVEKKPLKIELIKHIDIYKYDPWDLPKVSSLGDKEWYFFCIRGRKYRNSIRPNRVTGSGFWKATGIDKPIYSVREPHDCIGLKKSLVYYRGSAGKGTKTDWMMHEFRLPPNNGTKTNNLQPNPTTNLHEAEVWTLCRIFKRIPSHRKYTPPTPKDPAAAATKSQNPMTDLSSSKSGSFESDNYSKPYLTNFKDSVIQQNERKQTNNFGQVDERSHRLIMGQLQAAPFSTVSHNSSFWNPSCNIGDDVFANGNWDELRSVVQFAIDDDPSTVL